MIIGNGQLSKAFHKSQFTDDVCIFASGVSDSNCTEAKQFEREKELLIDALKNNIDNKFVYFSSCALSSSGYPRNAYYKHKANMEEIIKNYSNNYYIFRIPQLFGDLIEHKTLLNFIYKSIKHEHKFNIYDEAYRYVIEINDVRQIVEAYLQWHKSCIIIDIANPYKYKVVDIVKIFEKLINKRAYYNLIEKKDSYTLDLSSLENFIDEKKINIKFGKEYLMVKLKEKIRDTIEI